MRIICQEMLDQDILLSAGKKKSKFNHTDFYRFSFQGGGEGADNLAMKQRGQPGEAYQVSANLVNLVEALYASAIVTDEEGDQVLEIAKAVRSEEYLAYIKAVCQLQKVDISVFKPSKCVAFFLNVYQCMYVHQFFPRIQDVFSRRTD